MMIDFTQTPTIAGAIVFPEWAYANRPQNMGASTITFTGTTQNNNNLSIGGGVQEIQPSQS